jgi:uncharacterized protein (DUF1778 family)
MDTITRKKRTRLIIDISQDDKKLLKKIAVDEGKTLSKLVIDAIASMLLNANNLTQ